MKYIKLVISLDDSYHENLIAELSEIGFNAFEQQESTLITYLPTETFNEVHRERIEQVLAAYPGDSYIKSEEIIEEKNWNRQWEEAIKPIEVGSFFIKPTWSNEELPQNSILLEIDPKMSFGTGYHATTRLMLKLLPQTIEKDDVVMDAGTGTGILAIAAVKLGAKKVFAFDIDEWSINNATENILLNEVSEKVSIEKGGKEVISSDSNFDVVMANINRNTILNLLPAFSGAVKKGGIGLFSGLLREDFKMIRKTLPDNGFNILEKMSEEEWIGIKAEKVN